MANEDLKNWLVKSLNIPYDRKGEIVDYPKDGNYKKEIPLLIKFARKALTSKVNWAAAQKSTSTANTFIKDFKNFFNTYNNSKVGTKNPNVQTTMDYFSNISEKLNDKGIQVGDLKKVYQDVLNLIYLAENPGDFYKSSIPAGFEFFFDANKKGTLDFEECKRITDDLRANKNSPFRQTLLEFSDWNFGSSKSNQAPRVGEMSYGTFGRGANYTPDGENDNNDNDNNPEDLTNKKREEVQEKVADNIKTANEAGSGIPSYLRVLNVNPYTVREKINKNKNYDFKEEFEDWEKALKYIDGLYDYIEKKKAAAPDARKHQFDKAAKKVEPIRKEVKELLDEAKHQYDITHKLGYITDREAQNLVSKIINQMIIAEDKIIKLGRIIDDANIMTRKEARANIAKYFKRKWEETKRDVLEGSRTTRNIRDWKKDINASRMVKKIEKLFPPEEADKMKKEFMYAYYHTSEDNNQKIGEIKDAVSRAEDKKEISRWNPLSIFKKVKNNVSGSSDDTDFLSGTNDEKEIKENNSLVQKLKSIFAKKQATDPAYKEKSFSDFLKQEWQEAKKQTEQKKKEKEEQWAQGIFDRAKNKISKEEKKPLDPKQQEKENKEKEEDARQTQEYFAKKEIEDRIKQNRISNKKTKKNIFDIIKGKIK